MIQIMQQKYGGGHVVSVLAFYSNDPSSNLVAAYISFVKFVLEMTKKTKRRQWLANFFKYDHKSFFSSGKKVL